MGTCIKSALPRVISVGQGHKKDNVTLSPLFFLSSFRLKKTPFFEKFSRTRIFLVNIYELTSHEAKRAGKGGAV